MRSLGRPMRGELPTQAALAAATAPPGRVRALLRQTRTAWLILLGALVATTIAWRVSRNGVNRLIQDEFHTRVGQTEAAITDRMFHYEQVLRGAAGLFAASQVVQRDEWQDYVGQLEIDRRLPGLQGMGFVARIPARARTLHVEAIRKDGFPGYDVWPLGPRPDYFPVVFLAPFSGRNLRAFGFDMFSEPAQRAAMERARDGATSALSGRVRLQQQLDQDTQHRFVLYLPVYRRGLNVDTLAQRRSALLGFVYSAFRAKDLLRGILGGRGGDVALEIFDGSAAVPEALLVSTEWPTAVAGTKQRFPHLRAQRSIQVGGHPWLLRFSAGPQFQPDANLEQPYIVAIGGLFIGLLLFAIMTSLARTQIRAVALAEKMTVRMREATTIMRDQQDELVRAKNAAEDATRAKSQFLARMSHEMRTPLNGVVGMLDLALLTTLSRDQAEYLKTASTSAAALLEIINEVLDFSKIEAGKLKLDSTAFSLRELLESLLRSLAGRAHEKGIELLMPALGMIPDRWRGDPMRLRQVLTNLVGNAIKFTEHGQVVLLVAHQVAGGTNPRQILTFRISDSGIGIPEDKQRAIFEAFAQADETVSRRFGGTGLGLSISAQLVTLMGGSLGVESQEGRGSDFFFDLPLEGEEATPLPATPLGVPLPREHVLVWAAHPLVRQDFAEQVAAWGMKPSPVANLDAARAEIELARAAGNPVRWIILDAPLEPRDAAGVWTALLRNGGQLPNLVLAVPLVGPAAQRAQKLMTTPGWDAERVTVVNKPVLEKDLRAAFTRLAAGTGKRDVLTGPAAIPQLARVLHVLVAEDNATNQLIARRLLEVAGQKVTVVPSGRAAVAAVQVGAFDLILMDMRMPDLDGLEAARAIRLQERSTGGHIPIIAVTAQALAGDREQCLAAGMDGYVTKPLRPDALFEAIRSVTTAAPLARHG